MQCSAEQRFVALWTAVQRSIAQHITSHCFTVQCRAAQGSAAPPVMRSAVQLSAVRAAPFSKSVAAGCTKNVRSAKGLLSVVKRS